MILVILEKLTCVRLRCFLPYLVCKIKKKLVIADEMYQIFFSKSVHMIIFSIIVIMVKYQLTLKYQIKLAFLSTCSMIEKYYVSMTISVELICDILFIIFVSVFMKTIGLQKNWFFISFSCQDYTGLIKLKVFPFRVQWKCCVRSMSVFL